MKKGLTRSTIVIIICILVSVQLVVGICILIMFQPWKSNEVLLPNDGVWYCDEILTAIDFKLMDKYGYERCAVKYDTPDKTNYEVVYPKITMNSNQIIIESAKSNTVYLRGYADYSDNIFKIKSDSSDKTYTFVKTSDESLNDELENKGVLLGILQHKK